MDELRTLEARRQQHIAALRQLIDTAETQMRAGAHEVAHRERNTYDELVRARGERVQRRGLARRFAATARGLLGQQEQGAQAARQQAERERDAALLAARELRIPHPPPPAHQDVAFFTPDSPQVRDDLGTLRRRPTPPTLWRARLQHTRLELAEETEQQVVFEGIVRALTPARDKLRDYDKTLLDACSAAWARLEPKLSAEAEARAAAPSDAVGEIGGGSKHKKKKKSRRRKKSSRRRSKNASKKRTRRRRRA